MNGVPCFIGGEVAAAGWRLAGVRVITPVAGREAEALASAMGSAPLVLLEAEWARRLPGPTLEEAQRAVVPLVLVVPGVTAGEGVPDLGVMVRAQLGLGRES